MNITKTNYPLKNTIVIVSSFIFTAEFHGNMDADAPYCPCSFIFARAVQKFVRINWVGVNYEKNFILLQFFPFYQEPLFKMLRGINLEVNFYIAGGKKN